MSLTPEQRLTIETERPIVLGGLQRLLERCLVASSQTASPDAAAFFTQGAARRVGLLRRVVENVFSMFPLGTTTPLSRETLADLDINLHAFQINAHGLMDNWAWTFLHHHGLVERVGSPANVGMFQKKTVRHLPLPIRTHLKQLGDWSGDYAVPYRDALAHRIPAYLPPYVIRTSLVERYIALDEEMEAAKGKQDWGRCNELLDKQYAMGEPAFFFAGDRSDSTKTKPVVLHAQLLADSNTVIELGNVFLAHWLSPREDSLDATDVVQE